MARINQLRILLIHFLKVTIFSVLIPFLFSLNIGKSDFGYRVKKVSLNLAQKFPPAVALQLINSTNKIKTTQFSQENNKEFTELRAGYPTLDAFQLNEINFSFLSEENFNKIEISKNSSEPLDYLSKINLTNKEKEWIKKASNNKYIEQQELVFSDNTEIKSDIDKSDMMGTFLSGQIEFERNGSLALTDQHFIDVRRYEEGVPKEVAQVDLQGGTFSMNVQSTKGVIVARLTNQRGGVEGEANIPVKEFSRSGIKKLIMKKSHDRSPKEKSAYGDNSLKGKKSSIDLADSSRDLYEKESKFNVNEFDATSEFLGEARAEEHRPTVAMVNMISGSELVMLPEKMVEGLSEILQDQDIDLDLNRGDSLIWGTVNINGTPMSGASISLNSSSKTAYFGGLYLPDQTRTQTSENGMFAIPIYEPGWIDLMVQLDNGKKIYASALTYPGKVTQISIEIPTETLPVTIRTFDAFTGDSVRAKLEIQQLEEDFDTGYEGTAIVDLPKASNFSFILAKGEGIYLPVRVSYTNLIDYLHIPLIPRDWFESLKMNANAIESNETGSVAGFVQGDDFAVELQNNESTQKVIYFDQFGRTTPQGVSGGGFIIFNQSQNIPNIIVTSKRNKRKIIKTVRIDQKFLQSLYFIFE